MDIQPFKLERYFAKYEFNVKYLLCGSDCESMTINEVLALEPGAADLFQRQWLGYTDCRGAESLRREICGLYTSIQPDDVLVHCGAEEAIFLFMHSVLKAGDHILVHSPCYQSLAEVARSIGCEVGTWKAREENGWSIDMDDLKAGIKPNTSAVVINTPHNPTGYLMTRDDFAAVNSVVQERGIMLFSDEVYRESEYSALDRLPAACDVNANAVSLGVMSKTYGLPGLRIGWIATKNRDVYNRMEAMKDYTTICNSAPAEFLAQTALRHREKIVRRNREIISTNLEVLDGFFKKHSERFSWVRPKAGSIAFPRLIGYDVEAFCHESVTSAGVLLLPGTLFDDRDNHFRIGFGRKSMPEAVARLEEYLLSD